MFWRRLLAGLAGKVFGQSRCGHLIGGGRVIKVAQAKVVGKSLCGHLVGGSRITQILQAVHQLTLHAHQLSAVLKIGAYPVSCLPGHYLVYQPSPRIPADFKCRIEHDLR